jgi:aryl-alcohol dehydrogenase-like predicted oxidoreductase
MAVATRNLGRGGPLVTAVGLGLMGLSAFYGKPMPDEERFAFLSHAHRVGERFWDSADAYADNEDIIGEWFRRSGKRGDIFLATKFGGASRSPMIFLKCGRTDLTTPTVYSSGWSNHRAFRSRVCPHSLRKVAETPRSISHRLILLPPC